MKGLVVTAALSMVVAVVGCGGSTRTLTAMDVSNIPPGTAVGTELSGSYLVVSSSIDDCNCRAGSCSEFHGQPGATETMVQQDGALSIVDSGDSTGATALGGVNADDSFSAGIVDQIPSSVGQGVLYVLETGRFEVSAGVPTGMEFSADETITGTITGTAYDCDTHVSLSARYEGP